MIQSIISPKVPKNEDWKRLGPIDTGLGYTAVRWFLRSHRFLVISAVEVVNDQAAGEDIGPEYHLSVSVIDPQGQPQRIPSAYARDVLADFDLDDAKEDNHIPHGRVRHFWRPVNDALSGYECPCQETEPTMKEDKGDFVWRGVNK